MNRRSRAFPWVLSGVTLLTALWIMRSRQADQIQPPSGWAADHVAGFFPSLPHWQPSTVKAATSGIEPNIMAFRCRPQQDPADGPSGPAVLVRLVRGYNVVDCMRIKGYQVEDIAPERPKKDGQVWRMTKGDHADIWLTQMLDAATLAPVEQDTRSMAFPRIGTPDAEGWAPTGISWRGLRHPIQNLRHWCRAKWNSSRRNVLTFLRLKPPAWVSDRYLTLVIEGWSDKQHPASESVPMLEHLMGAFRTELQDYVQRSARRHAPAAPAADVN